MMMTPIHHDGRDRRHAPRARFSGITIVRTREAELPCVAGDVSESGMLLYPQRSLPVPHNVAVKVVFTLPNLARWIEVDAQVVRAHERRKRRTWALSFRQLADRDRQLLQAYVAEQRHADARASEAPTPAEVDLVPPESQGAATIEDMHPVFDSDEHTTQVFRRELS